MAGEDQGFGIAAMGDPIAQRMMTHYAPQPNPALPYIQALQAFLSGGLQGAANSQGIATPDWSKSLGALLTSPEANAALGVMGNAGPTVRLYHGTTAKGMAAINQSERINGPAFLTPTRRTAQDYADDPEHVIAVDVPKHALKIDADLPGAKLLSVEEANGYLDREGWDIDDYLRHGQSVGVDENVPLQGK